MNLALPANQFLRRMPARPCPSCLPKSDDTLQNTNRGGSKFARPRSPFWTQLSPPSRTRAKLLITGTHLVELPTTGRSGLIPPTFAKNNCTRRSRTWYTGAPRRVFYVFNFVKLRLAVRCRARQRIRLHKHDRAGSCRRTQVSLKVGCLNSLREV